MHPPSILALLASLAMNSAAAMLSAGDTTIHPSRITCTPGEYMCVMHAKDWAGPDEIWTCNAQGDLILSAICGGGLCCQDSGSGVKCVC